MLAGGRYEEPAAAVGAVRRSEPASGVGVAAAEGERRAKRGTSPGGFAAGEAAAEAEAAAAAVPQSCHHGVEAASCSVPDVPRRVAAVGEAAAEAAAPRGWPGGSGVARHWRLDVPCCCTRADARTASWRR